MSCPVRHRPVVAKLGLALSLVAPLLSGTAWAGPAPVHAAEFAPSPESRAAMKRALREFDRFLDHHPRLEDQLRVHPELTSAGPFLEANPVLKNFLEANPDVAAGLKLYPRYYLYRGLLRQASGPVSFAELSPLGELFRQEPALEKELTLQPERIRDPAFLKTHDPLLRLLAQHAALSRVFLSPAPRP